MVVMEEEKGLTDEVAGGGKIGLTLLVSAMETVMRKKKKKNKDLLSLDRKAQYTMIEFLISMNPLSHSLRPYRKDLIYILQKDS